MGIVVPFVQKPRRDTAGTTSAEIVIFPGVRIERHEDVDLKARVADPAAGGDYDGLAFGGPAS